MTDKQIIDQLKAENEQLKNFHINLVGVKECEIKELAELKAENKNLKDHLELATEMYGYKSEQLNQYKQAIEKIKEIANKHNLCDECSGLDDCERYCPENACSTYQMQFILQICDEVNDER